MSTDERPADPERPWRTRLHESVPSLIKWTGSKRSQARAIAALAPAHKRYIEPFLGGGALLFLLARRGSVAGDLYPPLVALWRCVQDAPEEVAAHYRAAWTALQTRGPEHFYKVRARFNETGDPHDLCFLMRTCVNGIVRFNASGAFNNSLHLSRRGMHPDRFAPLVKRWSTRIAGVAFREGDYRSTLEDCRPGDLVYLDPPYAGSRQRYIADLDIEGLLTTLERLNRAQVRWMLSFDGERGEHDLTHPLPRELYRRHLLLPNGHSAVAKVLNGPLQSVRESIYLNFD